MRKHAFFISTSDDSGLGRKSRLTTKSILPQMSIYLKDVSLAFIFSPDDTQLAKDNTVVTFLQQQKNAFLEKGNHFHAHKSGGEKRRRGRRNAGGQK